MIAGFWQWILLWPSALCRQRCFAHLRLGGGVPRGPCRPLGDPGHPRLAGPAGSLVTRYGLAVRYRRAPDAAITGSTSCLATAPCARSSASQTGPTSKSKAQRPSWNLLPHPLLNKNLIKHDLGQTKPFPRKNVCASLETQKAQGACWR